MKKFLWLIVVTILGLSLLPPLPGENMNAFEIPPETDDINNWIKLAQYYKKMWVDSTERGDLTPTVFAERDGVVICSVIAPQVDKMLGLRVAAMLRRGLEADVLTIILDAHVWTGKNIEDKPKNMQKACDEEGACEAGLISDCLNCIRIDKNKKTQMLSMPYSYHGKGTEFKWLNDPEKFCEAVITDNNPDGDTIQGNVPNALRQIMDMPLVSNDPFLKIVAKGLSRQKALYHTTRALYGVLSLDGYMVIDFLGHDKPWEIFETTLQPKKS